MYASMLACFVAECPVRKALPPCPYGTACYRPVHCHCLTALQLHCCPAGRIQFTSRSTLTTQGTQVMSTSPSVLMAPLATGVVLVGQCFAMQHALLPAGGTLNTTRNTGTLLQQVRPTHAHTQHTHTHTHTRHQAKRQGCQEEEREWGGG